MTTVLTFTKKIIVGGCVGNPRTMTNRGCANSFELREGDSRLWENSTAVDGESADENVRNIGPGG